MARHSVIPPESFEEILAWLDPDRDVAANRYLQLREDLTNIFKWKGCTDPEGLTDDVFDRVAKKVHEIRPTYEGDPRLYFRAVANNVAKEFLKRVKTQVSLEDVVLADRKSVHYKEESAEDRAECLQLCLRTLTSEDRELILGYYSKEKQAKIDHRCELAQQCGMSLATLRVKVHRVRKSLQKCIQRCLKNKVE